MPVSLTDWHWPLRPLLLDQIELFSHLTTKLANNISNVNEIISLHKSVLLARATFLTRYEKVRYFLVLLQ